MKKLFAFLICIITCLALLSSCNVLKHEHTMSDWKYNKTEHWREPVCGINNCIIQAEVHDLGEHSDEDENEICDVCGYKIEHEHTITYVSAGESGHFENYTCGCPHDHGAVPHYDENGDYICDACGYVMPKHEHTYKYNHDDIGHGWYYTCGCMTPPNFAQHFDGDGDAVSVYNPFVEGPAQEKFVLELK